MRIGAVLDTLSCRHLTHDEARAAFTHLMGGAWSEVEIAALIAEVAVMVAVKSLLGVFAGAL